MAIKNLAQFKPAIDEIAQRIHLRNADSSVWPKFSGGGDGTTTQSFKIVGSQATAHVAIKDGLITEICIEGFRGPAPGFAAYKHYATPTSCEHNRRTGHKLWWRSEDDCPTNKDNFLFGLVPRCACKVDELMVDHRKVMDGKEGERRKMAVEGDGITATATTTLANTPAVTDKTAAPLIPELVTGTENETFHKAGQGLGTAREVSEKLPAASHEHVKKVEKRGDRKAGEKDLLTMTTVFEELDLIALEGQEPEAKADSMDGDHLIEL